AGALTQERGGGLPHLRLQIARQVAEGCRSTSRCRRRVIGAAIPKSISATKAPIRSLPLLHLVAPVACRSARVIASSSSKVGMMLTVAGIRPPLPRLHRRAEHHRGSIAESSTTEVPSLRYRGSHR